MQRRDVLQTSDFMYMLSTHKGCYQPFMQRALSWDTSALPVPADVMVYTQAEWVAMARRNSRFYREAARQAVWVYERPQDASASP